MNKPEWPGTYEGQGVQEFDRPGYWIWRFKPAEKPLFKLLSSSPTPLEYTRGSFVQPNEIATGLTRKEAARLAGVLLRATSCNGVMIEPLPVPGEWVFHPSEPTQEVSNDECREERGTAAV